MFSPSCRLCPLAFFCLPLADSKVQIVAVRTAMKKVTSPGVDRTGEMSTNTEAASSSSDQPCRVNNGVLAEILQDDTAQRRLLEAGSELMLQRHLDYNGYLTTSEQTKWKNIITNALSEKSFNDTSKYLIDKLREPYKTKLLKFLYSNCGLLETHR